VIAQVALALSLTGPPDNWFGPDKLKHFFVGAFTQSVAYSALQLGRVRHDRALAGAWAVTAAVSIAKEVHDKRSYGLFSVRDLVWDAAGAGAATLVIRRAVRSESGADKPAATISASARDTELLLSGGWPGPILPQPKGPGSSFAPRR